MNQDIEPEFTGFICQKCDCDSVSNQTEEEKWEQRRWDLVTNFTLAIFNKERFNLENYRRAWKIDADSIVGKVDAIIERYRND